MSNQIVPDVYSAVILDVVNKIRQSEGEIEVEESVLVELQKIWLQKIFLSSVPDSPSRVPGEDYTYGYSDYYNNNVPGDAHRPPNPQSILQGPPGDGEFDSVTALQQKFAEEDSINGGERFGKNIVGSKADLESQKQFKMENDGAKGHLDKRGGERNDGCEYRESDPSCIGSDLDDEDSEEEGKDVNNLILCQYERVRRTKNKWKCTLRNGIMNVDGRDYLFGKAQCEFEW